MADTSPGPNVHGVVLAGGTGASTSGSDGSTANRARTGRGSTGRTGNHFTTGGTAGGRTRSQGKSAGGGRGAGGATSPLCVRTGEGRGGWGRVTSRWACAGRSARTRAGGTSCHRATSSTSRAMSTSATDRTRGGTSCTGSGADRGRVNTVTGVPDGGPDSSCAGGNSTDGTVSWCSPSSAVLPLRGPCLSRPTESRRRRPSPVSGVPTEPVHPVHQTSWFLSLAVLFSALLSSPVLSLSLDLLARSPGCKGGGKKNPLYKKVDNE